MRILPKFHQFIEVLGGYQQDVFYVAAAGIPGANSVPPIGKRDRSFGSVVKSDNRFYFCIESVHMARLVVFRIGNKSNPVRTEFEPTLQGYSSS